MEDIIKEMRAHGATCADLKTTAAELCALLKKTDEFSSLQNVRISKYYGSSTYVMRLKHKDGHGMDITVKVESNSAGADFIIAALKKVKE